MRDRLLLLRSKAITLFIDDKAKIPVGEPSNSISTGVRGLKFIAPGGTTYAALDHDMNRKTSIISTVYIRPTTPPAVQDAVLDQSTPFQNDAATIKLSRASGLEQPSDGGAEHRNVLTKVQLSLIAIFKELNLEMLIAARCAPGQSWVVERVMSLRNIGLQNCTTERLH